MRYLRKFEFVKYPTYKDRIFMVTNLHPMVIDDTISDDHLEVYVLKKNVEKLERATPEEVKDFYLSHGREWKR